MHYFRLVSSNIKLASLDLLEMQFRRKNRATMHELCKFLRLILPLLWICLQRDDVYARKFGQIADHQEEGDAAVVLTEEMFNSSLWAAPEPWTIVEFYAHWCPACQNFKPQYARIAELFNGADSVYPGVVFVAKVDCVLQVNGKLCERFSVQRYPTMLWAKPDALAWGSRQGESESNIVQVDSHFNAKSLLDWINNRLGKSYSLEALDEKKELVRVSNSQTGQLAVSIDDIEEATVETYNIMLDNELVSSTHRAPFVQFLQLLAGHHPSKRCRVGSSKILSNLVDIWPAEHLQEADDHGLAGGSQRYTARADVKELRRLSLCGKGLPRGTYKSCSMVTGGYSCGLWYLFHALSVRVDNSESKSTMKTIRDVVGNFFICEECRVHFLKLSEHAIDEVSSRRDLTLWLWRAHNEVNTRLSKLQSEKSSLKVQWPPKQMCTSCRVMFEKKHASGDDTVEWDEDKVYQFMKKIYGKSLETVADETKTTGTGHLDEDTDFKYSTTSSAFAVPVGAAIGIAMASCGFGVAAFCWRLQQKKSKHMRRRV